MGRSGYPPRGPGTIQMLMYNGTCWHFSWQQYAQEETTLRFELRHFFHISQIDEQTPDNSPRITPRMTPPTKDNGPLRVVHDNTINKNNVNIIEQMRMANEKTLELQDQVSQRISIK